MNELTVYASPTLDTSAIERANLQPSTKLKYRREITAMVDAGVNPSNHLALQLYADGLKSSRKQFLKSALRLMLQGYEQDISATATAANLKETQAALLRLNAMKNAVVVPQVKGTKAHRWLSKREVSEITALCPDTLEGKRDYIILACLLAAGLRRQELCDLTFDDLKQQPMKSGKLRTVIEIKHGKGDKSRVVPINEELTQRLREWYALAGEGRIARSLGKSMTLGESINAASMFELVRKYGAKIGVPELACHDCRRTFAQLAYESGVPITQISVLLGHQDISTTTRYLNLSLDIEQTASDFVPLA
jgi:integrase